VRAIHFEELGKERLAWIYPDTDGSYEFADSEPQDGRVAVRIRYLSQRESEAMGRKLQASGVLKRKQKGGQEIIDWVPGKELARNEIFAKSMVVDLRGFTDAEGKDMPYTHELMASAFANVRGLFDAVASASRELDAFFVGNGNGSYAS
jgi:hypothetical protein